MPFTPEQDRFLLEAYFRTGQCSSAGTWVYSLPSCRKEFDTAYPDQEVKQTIFKRHIKRLVDRFHNTGSVCKGKSSGRTPKCNDELISKFKRIKELDPTISIGKLANHAGICYNTCQRIVASFQVPKVEQVKIETG